jgi:hypothetical protein
VQVNRDIQLAHFLPEWQHLGFVEVLGGILVAKIAVAIDQRTSEAQILDRSLQLVRSGFWVLQRERSKDAKALRMLSQVFLSSISIHLSRHIDSLTRIRKRLNAWLGQRKNRRLNPIAIHQLQAQVRIVEMLLHIGKVLLIHKRVFSRCRKFG